MPACRATALVPVKSSESAAGLTKGTSAPPSRATSAIAWESVDTTTRSNSPHASAASIE